MFLFDIVINHGSVLVCPTAAFPPPSSILLSSGWVSSTHRESLQDPTLALSPCCMPSDRYAFEWAHSAMNNEQRARAHKLDDFLFFALKVIRDYTTPPNEELSRDLFNKLKPYIRSEKHTPAFTKWLNSIHWNAKLLLLSFVVVF